MSASASAISRNNPRDDDRPKLRPGGRNLLTLCAFSLILAITTTLISLSIYRSAGDIYLDRSRPGFIDDDEIVDNNDGVADFSNEGAITKDVLEEYREDIEKIQEHLEKSSDAFSDSGLSDARLGLSE